MNVSSFAQNAEAGTSRELIASRNGTEKHYKRNARLLLSYESNSSSHKIKGIFVGVVDGNALLIRKKSNDTTMIPIENITTLKRIKPTRRIIYSVAGMALIGVGATVVGGGGSSPASGMKTAIVVPIIGAGAYFLYAIPASLLFEKLNEKKRSNGWSFSYQ